MTGRVYFSQTVNTVRQSAFRGNGKAWSLFDSLTRSVQIPEGPVTGQRRSSA